MPNPFSQYGLPDSEYQKYVATNGQQATDQMFNQYINNVSQGFGFGSPDQFLAGDKAGNAEFQMNQMNNNNGAQSQTYGGGNGTQAQGGRAGMAGGVDPYNYGATGFGMPDTYRGTQRQYNTNDSPRQQYPNESPRQQGDYTTPYSPTRYIPSTNWDSLMNSMSQLDPNGIYVDRIASDFTNTQLGQYASDVNMGARYLGEAGRAGIAGYQGILNTANQTANQLMGAAGQYQGITDQYGQSANAMRQYANQAAMQNMGYAQRGASAQLNNLTGMLGMYRNAANQTQLPGQRLIEQNMGATTSQALDRIRQYGGSSNAALGAIGNVYGSQLGAQRDLGLQAANYQDSQRQNYMAALGNAGQQYGNIYGQLGNAAMAGGNLMGQAEQAAASMYGGAAERQLGNTQNMIQTAGQARALGQQGLTEAQVGASQGLAQYYAGLAPQTANMLSALQQQRINAEMTQSNLSRQAILDAAQMMGQGLQTGAQYQDQAWQANQYNPYMQNMNYYNAMVNGGGGMGGGNALMNAAMGMQGQAMNNYNANQMAWGQFLGNAAQMGVDIFSTIYNK